MIIEPILREPGSVSFSWMEIQRTKASLVQQINQQTNNTANETLLEFGLFPKDGECEHRCPELNACIASNLWCDGKHWPLTNVRNYNKLILGVQNCPSGVDESSRECGATRKLLSMPAGLYAALACIAAAIAACLIFCVVGISRRKKKPEEPKYSQANVVAQTAIPNGNHTYSLPKSNGNTYQKNSLYYNDDHDSWHMLPPVDYVDYIHVDRETTGNSIKTVPINNYLTFPYAVWPSRPESSVDYESFYYANETIDYNSIYSNNHHQERQQQPKDCYTYSKKFNYLVTILF